MLLQSPGRSRKSMHQISDGPGLTGSCMRSKQFQRGMLLQPLRVLSSAGVSSAISPPQVCLLPVTPSEISLPPSPATLWLLEVCLPLSLDVVDGQGQLHLKSVPSRVLPSNPCSRRTVEPQDQQAPKAEERPKGPVSEKERERKDQRLSHLDTPFANPPGHPEG